MNVQVNLRATMNGNGKGIAILAPRARDRGWRLPAIRGAAARPLA